MMGKTISLLGLGWLGLPLAKTFLEKGFIVKGSVTTTEKLKEFTDSKIDLSVVKLHDNYIEFSNENFFKTDILFINFPPKRVDGIELLYPNQVSQLLPFINRYGIKWVLFISSTSVYNETNGVVTEDDELSPEKSSGRACLNAENILRRSNAFDTTIIRFGGLIGADRNPHRFMKRGVKNGPGKKQVNLIHLDDCIGIITHIVDCNFRNGTINACCPVHPTREAFYTAAAKAAHVEAPQFENTSAYNFKLISSSKLTDQLGYRFKYKNPLDYLQDYEQGNYNSVRE